MSLLFFVYINDLPGVSNQLHSVLFADNTCLSLFDTNYGRLIRKFSYELIKFDNWMMANRVTLNVVKTAAMYFSKRFHDAHSVLRIINKNLSFVEFTKYLGVFIDTKLTFTKHVETICKKISKNIGLLNRISIFSPGIILERLYCAFFFIYELLQFDMGRRC